MSRLNKTKLTKALVLALELLALGVVIYLIALPLLPVVKYKLSQTGESSNVNWQDINTIKEKTEQIISSLPKDPLQEKSFPVNQPPVDSENIVQEQKNENVNNKKVNNTAAVPKGENIQPSAMVSNRLIIPKIGVNAPIIDSQDGDFALSRGSWRLPEGSTPDKGSNTILTGHRFKYLPPNNLTFYLFHKLEEGDIISVVWENKNYYYRIKLKKIVDSDDGSILLPTDKPTLTLFTCDPIYSQKNRLVIVAELVEENS